ncbi:hypothetical protein NESM_000395200 [Novymonas esmeraldas]|uniref:Uncharacterized protein n=1 Tax=Novymonas esmeraldas TaxID=1808958 RepID=A0AAW0EMS5_9TRYP
MKRSREEVDVDGDAAEAQSAPATVAPATTPSTPVSSPPHALPFEMIFGLTSRRSGPLEAERAALMSRLLGATAASSAPASSASSLAAAAVTAVDVAALMDDDMAVCLGGFTKELVYQQLLQCSEEGSLLRLLTVELVANDGHTLVLAPPQPVAEADGAPGASPLLMNVVADGAVTGAAATAHPGDLLLLRYQPRQPLAAAAAASEADADDSGAASGAAWATHHEFITYNAARFAAADVDLWREAAEGSMATVVRWLAELMEQPPGLAQLAFLEAAAASSSVSTGASTHAGGGRAGGEGWRRALQLPMLLRLRPDAMGAADAQTLERLRHTASFALRTLAAVFLNVESAMRLPRLCQRLAYLFLASPLYIDGASQVSMQLLATDSTALTLRGVSQTLHSCVVLGLQYASDSAAVSADTALATAELRHSAQLACNGFELLLARLSHVWLQQQQVPSGRSSGAAVGAGGPAEAIVAALEAVADTGVLREALRWLQLEEDIRRARDRLDGDRGAGADDLVDAIAELLVPPTLPRIHDGRHLQERAVAEQLAALRRTYNPSLSRDVQPFLRGTALAAYAELYGSTARAVRRVTRLPGGAEELCRGRVDGAIAVRVSAVEAVGPRAGGLAEYTLAEVQHHAAFGLPVHLRVRGSRERRHQDEMKALTAALQASRVSDTDASLFAYVVVQLDGQWIVFPAVLTHTTPQGSGRERGGGAAAATLVTAHVLRDADMLADFVLTSAAAAVDGQAPAWIVLGADAAGHQRRGSRRRRAALLSATAAAPPERVLPLGTPALTYLDCLRRLHRLAVSVRQAGAGASGKGRGGAANASRRSGGGDGSSGGGPFSADAVAGLWTEHFAAGTVPTQRYTASLTTSVAALLSGTGSTSGTAVAPDAAAGAPRSGDAQRTSRQTLLASLGEAVGFSSAQMEALHSLTAGTSITSPTTRTAASHRSGGGGGGVPVSVRAVDGCTGSGKTAVLYASALVRGRLHAAARLEQQRTVQSRLKQAMASVKDAAAALRGASVAELFSPRPEARASRSLLEDASAAAAEARRCYQQLNEAFLYCSTPLLLRPAVATSTVPAAVAELLFASAAETTAAERGDRDPRGAPVWRPGEITSLAALVRESHARSLNAPLTAQLNAELHRLACTGRWSGGSRAAPWVAAPLLSLTMSARDAADVAARAAASPLPARTWAAFVSTDLWPESEVAATLDAAATAAAAAAAASARTAPASWETLAAAPEERFAPVTMPSTTYLSALSKEQLEGWHSVYLEKQGELAHHVHAAVHESVKAVFQLLLDLVWGVAATSQSTRHTLTTSTPTELTQGLLLPCLWCWQPAHLCVDDVDAVQDGFFAMLTPVSSFVYSLTSEVPAFQERRRSHERIALALLRSLGAELKRTGDLTTTALRDSLRCRRAEVQALLRCTIDDVRALAAVGAAAAAEEEEKPTSGSGDEGGDGGGDGHAEEVTEAAEPPADEADTAVPPPVFPGLASYSAVEVWSHGASVTNCVAADTAAAVFLMEYLSSYDHATSSRGGAADAPASSTPPARISYGVYTSTAAEAETMAEALSRSALARSPRMRQSVRIWKESLEDAGNEAVSPASVVTTAPPATAAPVSYTSLEEAECEAEVGIVCLSGLLQVAVGALHKSRGGAAAAAADAGVYRPDVRHQQWRQLWAESPDGSPSLFVTRLQWWLWRLLRRVRRGVVLVGSRELFACLPLFSKAEFLVQRQRRLLAPRGRRAYWLPAEVGASVLALVCPDHYKCRRIAIVHEHDAKDDDDDDGAEPAEAPAVPDGGEDEDEDGGPEEEAVAVHVHGPTKCQSLCLQVYDVCPNPSHACLRPCHAQRSVTAADAVSAAGQPRDGPATEEAPHASCPYPCDAVPPCGHVSHRVCGAPEEPCAFVGLTELSCGQRVVSGTDSHQVVQYAFFPHFQECRCGEPAGLCRVPVSVLCARCGCRSMVPCHRVTTQLSRRRHAAAEEEDGAEETNGAEGADAGGGTATYMLEETACAGCVALYNKVAKKFGYELLSSPAPMADVASGEPAAETATATAQGDEDAEEEEDVVGTALPRHLLSTEAHAELRREFTIAGKKCELLLRKEALEISSGRATEKTDYAVYRAQHEAAKATQRAQEKAWRDAYQAILDGWAVTLRQALEVQTALNTELDTLMPRLVAEATEEAQAQRAQFAE